MKTRSAVPIVIILVFSLLFLGVVTGTFNLSFGFGNLTVKEIVKNNPNADILLLDGIVFSNVTNADWVKENEYEKSQKIGIIKKQTTNTWWFRNFYAFKLPKGTKLFSVNGQTYEEGDAPYIILVELHDELLVYQALVEG
ncbi:hypothetical protein [Bacillus pinisoli]|uniref:hypothetical protein n=1 Tax=Bacillus pinisoli TaxID=2901866 RepID=UPI001FF65346|nr:hypothetical protein [Bacillus pinisoli]